MTQPVFNDDIPSDAPLKRHGSAPSLLRTILIVVIGSFAILVVWAIQPAKRFGQGDIHPAVGQALESFEVTSLEDDTPPATLESLHGKVVLINYWGTWCPPCMMEFPHLVELNNRLKSDVNFRFVPVVCGPGGTDVELTQLRESANAYLATLNSELAVYYDPHASARRSLVNSAHLSGFSFPTTLLLNRSGTIQGIWQGYAPGVESEMEAAIKNLLES